MRRRMLSLRAFDTGHMLIDADVVDGRQVETVIERLLGNPKTAYVQAHYAKHGCYAARIERAQCRLSGSRSHFPPTSWCGLHRLARFPVTADQVADVIARVGVVADFTRASTRSHIASGNVHRGYNGSPARLFPHFVAAGGWNTVQRSSLNRYSADETRMLPLLS